MIYPEDFYLASDGEDYAPAARRLIEHCHTYGDVPALCGGSIYRFNSTVIDPYGLHWIAEPGCLIVNGSTNTPALQLGTTGGRTYRGSIDGSITFASAVAGVDGQYGLRVFNTGLNSFGRLVVVDYAPYLPLHRGILFEDVAVSSFTPDVQGCLSDGVTLLKTIDAHAWTGRSDANGGAGFKIMATQGAHLSGIACYKNLHGFHWAANPADINKNCFLVSLVGDTSVSDCMLIEDLSDTELVACWGCSQEDTTINPEALGWRLRGSLVRGIKFIGGFANNNNGDGMVVEVETDSAKPTYGAPFGIVMDQMDFGTTANYPNGNGQSGNGWGLRLSAGLASGAVTQSGGTFAGNASGDVINASGPEALISTDWTSSFVPVISSTSGTVTSSSATCEYRRDGDLVHLTATISITTNGTGSGDLLATLPVPAAATGYHVFVGREAVISGKMLSGFVGPDGQTLFIRDYANGYPGVDGAVIVVNGWYRSA